MKQSDIDFLMAEGYMACSKLRTDPALRDAELKAAEYFMNQSVIHQAEEVADAS